MTTPRGPARPGQDTIIWVAGSNHAGRPVAQPPRVVLGDQVLPILGAGPSDGIWSYLLKAPSRGNSVNLLIDVEGVTRSWELPLEAATASSLSIPDRIDLRSDVQDVEFLVTGAELPPAESLDVLLTDGELRSVVQVPDGLLVTVRPEQRREARSIPVAVRDRRKDNAPVWTSIQVSHQVRLEYQAEAGTTMRVRVGSRQFGPYGAQGGGVRGTILQRPGDTVAMVTLRDSLGNESSTPQQLPAQVRPQLLAVPIGTLKPGHPTPDVYLRATHWDGSVWRGAPPICKTPAEGRVDARQFAPGVWRVIIASRLSQGQDVRLSCALGDVIEASIRIPVARRLPTRLRLRAYPEELSTDFPVSEIQVHLEDNVGERLPVAAVQVAAQHGAVRVGSSEGLVVQGEYQGNPASVRAGGDQLTATYTLPLGEGAVDSVLVAHGSVPHVGMLTMMGRAFNEQGLPLSGVPIHLTAGDAAERTLTNEQGWASASVPIPEGTAPLILEARSAHRIGRGLTFRGSRASANRPGLPDLTDTRRLVISAGRVSQVDLALSTNVLYWGPDATARVNVRLLDGADSIVLGEWPIIEATEGKVGPIQPSINGGYFAEYTPPPGEIARTVVISARARSGSITATRELRVEPAPVLTSLGLSVGAVSNLGRINTFTGSIDYRQRLGFFDGRVMLIMGMSAYNQPVEVDSSVLNLASDESYRTHLTVMPITLGFLARQDWGLMPGWLGLGGVVAPYRIREQFGTAESIATFGVLPPGFTVMSGLSRRVALGEISFELRGLFLYRPAKVGGLQGLVGGVTALIGYHLIIK